MNDQTETPYGKNYEPYYDEQKGRWNFRLKEVPRRKPTKWMSQLDIHEGACYAGKRGEGKFGYYVRKVERIIDRGARYGKLVQYTNPYQNGSVSLSTFARWARTKVGDFYRIS